MNKAVCQQCYLKHDAIWAKSDDLRWSRGEVACWCHSWVECTMVARPDRWWALNPIYCPYVLEHCILNQSSPEIDIKEWIDSIEQEKL